MAEDVARDHPRSPGSSIRGSSENAAGNGPRFFGAFRGKAFVCWAVIVVAVGIIFSHRDIPQISV